MARKPFDLGGATMSTRTPLPHEGRALVYHDGLDVEVLLTEIAILLLSVCHCGAKKLQEHSCASVRHYVQGSLRIKDWLVTNKVSDAPHFSRADLGVAQTRAVGGFHIAHNLLPQRILPFLSPA